MNKQDIIDQLSLKQHVEGGYFLENYRSPEQMETDREGNQRAVMTSIYYLLTDDQPIDHLIQNKSDIMHYFQAGWPITYILVDLEGNLSRVKLGLGIANGETPQLMVPKGYWKAAVLEAGEYGLLGEAVAPGFDYRDMTMAKADEIKARFPDIWEDLKPYVRA